MRRVPYYNQARVYSNSWNYPGNYEGSAEHPAKVEVIVDTSEYAPDDFDYIEELGGFPYDLTNLDKPIDLMDDTDPTFYDLMDDNNG